ncbi:50S ribosomal protein L13, partial [Vibrio alginolyticus 12G01]
YRSYFEIEGREYQRLEGVMTGLLDSVGALLGVPLKFKI